MVAGGRNGLDNRHTFTPGFRSNLMGAASSVTWLILVFFVPMVVVSGC